MTPAEFKKKVKEGAFPRLGKATPAEKYAVVSQILAIAKLPWKLLREAPQEVIEAHESLCQISVWPDFFDPCLVFQVITERGTLYITDGPEVYFRCDQYREGKFVEGSSYTSRTKLVAKITQLL